MVFYVGNMIKKLSNPTIVVVTDRNDLDDQLYETFLSANIYLKQDAIQIESRKDLTDKLEGRSAGGIIFTTLQKFEEESGLYSERDNILVLVDEAHRSHYGINPDIKIDRNTLEASKKYGTAKYLHEALPNAIYIGFTGTPVETKNKSTSNIFGDVIDVYDMTQAILDGATVPIVYEGRMARVGLNQKVLDAIDDYYSELEKDEERKDLVANKAMVVAYSRKSAYLMYKKFIKVKPEWAKHIRIIITSNNKDSEEMQRFIGSKSDKEQNEKDFKKENSDFKIAIVVDMWLTGFDVPSLGTMYIDKPMKAHNLMQAIARVNRVYKDKEGGIIVDYIGLKKFLLEALKTYTTRDQGKIIDNTLLLKALNDKLELIRNLFYGFNYHNFAAISDKEKYNLIQDGANHILYTEIRKKQFMKYCYDVKNLYSLCTGILDEKQKEEILYFISVRSFISKLSGDKPDINEINEHVGKLIEDAIQEDEMLVLSELNKNKQFNLLSSAIFEKLKQMKNKNVAADILQRALKEIINQIGKTNLILMEKFSGKFNRLATKYNERINIEDTEKIIQEMFNLKQEIEKEITKGNEYDLSVEKKPSLMP